ncbi:MAG: heavy metal translocating P-type ATPase, partial [bacterium]
EAGAEVTELYRHETMNITDMDCGDCAASIEHILGRVDGILSVSVNYAAEKMRVEYFTELLSHEDIVKRVASLGYKIEEEKRVGWLCRNWGLLLSLLCGVFLAFGFFAETFFALPFRYAVVLYVLAYLTGGWDATKHGIKAALRLRFDIDFLMVVAAIGAAVLGEWPEGAFLLFLFSLGHALEHYATDKARHAIKALGEITPNTARVRRDGAETEMSVEKLERGDVVIVGPGERIPIDGKVIDGESAVDESPITGESVPVEKNEGTQVFAGSINGDGALEIEVTKLAKDSTLARVIQMVEEAQTQKSPTQRFTQRFQGIFVPVILVGVLAVIFVPPLIGLLAWDVAFLRAMAILVAASPCALAIATPSAVLSAIARAARNGVLIKGGVHLENLGTVKAIAFDKTGTLTEGKLEVTDVQPLQDTSAEELLKIAAAVESRSNHPLAQAIVRKAQEKNIAFTSAEDLQSFSGKGVQANLDGKTIAIGNLKLFGEDVPKVLMEKVQTLEQGGKTTMVVRADGRFLGIIGLADQPRAAAKTVLEKLQRLGIKKRIMITGDNERVAAAIAKIMDLTDFRASLLPDEKVAAIKELTAKHKHVAMVGDGVNDAPAMTTATVGIAMGAGGTDVALETADVALMADDLSKLPFAVGLSRQSRRIIKQNLVISLGVIAALIPAALFGMAGIAIAIVFHEGSTLVVVANALRMLRFSD